MERETWISQVFRIISMDMNCCHH